MLLSFIITFFIVSFITLEHVLYFFIVTSVEDVRNPAKERIWCHRGIFGESTAERVGRYDPL